jgi:DNA-directed RNA polymerase specialized sigma24 family protein
MHPGGVHSYVLKKLSVIDPRKSRVVDLRFFGGLNAEETASVLQVSLRTVEREWILAKARYRSRALPKWLKSCLHRLHLR